MKNTLLLAIVLGFVLIGCNKENENAVPTCVQDKLETFGELHACPTGASLKEYLFQSKTVYVYFPGICGADMTSEVIDDNCAVLGLLGGITGETEIGGVDFYANAIIQSTIWQN